MWSGHGYKVSDNIKENTIILKDAVSIVIYKSQLTNLNTSVATTLYRKINFSNVNWYVHVYLGKCQLHLTCEGIDILGFGVLPNGKMVDGIDLLKKSAPNAKIETYPCCLSDYFVNGRVSLKFIVAFKVKKPILVSPTNHVYLSCDHYPNDFELMVNKKSIKVHRHFLAMLSPVFHAMFTHDTIENRTGKSEIEGIDYKSVVNAVDFIYGRKVELTDTNVVIGILRFGDKYDIKSITAALQYIPYTNKLDKNTFCNVLSYAYDMSLGALMVFCGEYFKENLYWIPKSPSFRGLPIPVILNFLSAAYGTNDNLEIFHLACKDDMLFITDYLEPYIISGLTMDTFCSIISFTFKYNREKIKPLCAAFFNQHAAEIMNMPEFVNLESDAIKQILKAALDLKITESGRTS